MHRKYRKYALRTIAGPADNQSTKLGIVAASIKEEEI